MLPLPKIFSRFILPLLVRGCFFKKVPITLWFKRAKSSQKLDSFAPTPLPLLLNACHATQPRVALPGQLLYRNLLECSEMLYQGFA